MEAALLPLPMSVTAVPNITLQLSRDVSLQLYVVSRCNCDRHYPQLKATVVADTPEMKRYDQLSKQQSQVCLTFAYLLN